MSQQKITIPKNTALLSNEEIKAMKKKYKKHD